MGVVGFLFFFLALLLHVAWDYCRGPPPLPADWRDWLGEMAVLNAISLVAYRFASRIPSYAFRRKPKFGWKLSRSRFTLVAFLLLAGSCGSQLGVYPHFGGVSGAIETFRSPPLRFLGVGWPLVVP